MEPDMCLLVLESEQEKEPTEHCPQCGGVLFCAGSYMKCGRCQFCLCAGCEGKDA